MKVYEGKRIDDKAVVTVDGEPLDPAFEIRNHSPSGFNWGYGGSGPAQLGLAIVVDHLRIKNALCSCQDVTHKRRFEVHHDVICELGQLLEVLHRHYQRFKELFVARFEQDGWKLKEEDVRICLIELESERRAREKLGKP